jgi:hypothetical protein
MRLVGCILIVIGCAIAFLGPWQIAAFFSGLGVVAVCYPSSRP